MHRICAALLSASFAISSSAHAAPAKFLCELLPKAKAAELMGTPVTIASPPDPTTITIQAAYTRGPVSCYYIGGATGLVAAVSMIPIHTGITRANFFPNAEHVEGLGVFAAFVADQKMLAVVLPGSAAMIEFSLQGSKDPNLKTVLIQLATQTLPNVPAYVDHTPPSKIFRGWIESGDPHTAIGTPPEQVRDNFMRGGQYEFVDDATGQSARVDDYTSARGYDGLHIEVNGYFYPGEPKFHITNIISVIKSAPMPKSGPSQK